MNWAKATYIWCKRFRKRKGYGVHSPFAFDFITNVINERARYYAYSELKGKNLRLLFRVANYVQPTHIIDFGGRLSARAMQMAKPSAHLITLESGESLQPDMVNEESVVLFHVSKNADLNEVFLALCEVCNEKCVAIIEGVHADKFRLAQWKGVVEHEKSGITFDTYSHGIVFFDKSRYKQDYIVNF